jgi:hypothetical protein
LSFDPYTQVCPRYNVVVAHSYDYWWLYNYHPGRVAFAFSGPFWSFEIRTGPYRPNRYRYMDCAWGFSNYYPVYRPTRPLIVVQRVVPPRIAPYRQYIREYHPVRYSETRTRNSGPIRSGSRVVPAATGTTRSRTVEPTVTPNRDRSGQMRTSRAERIRTQNIRPDRSGSQRAATGSAAIEQSNKSAPRSSSPNAQKEMRNTAPEKQVKAASPPRQESRARKSESRDKTR